MFITNYRIIFIAPGLCAQVNRHDDQFKSFTCRVDDYNLISNQDRQFSIETRIVQQQFGDRKATVTFTFPTPYDAQTARNLLKTRPHLKDKL